MFFLGLRYYTDWAFVNNGLKLKSLEWHKSFCMGYFLFKGVADFLVNFFCIDLTWLMGRGNQVHIENGPSLTIIKFFLGLRYYTYWAFVNNGLKLKIQNDINICVWATFS